MIILVLCDPCRRHEKLCQCRNKWIYMLIIWDNQQSWQLCCVPVGKQISNWCQYRVNFANWYQSTKFWYHFDILCLMLHWCLSNDINLLSNRYLWYTFHQNRYQCNGIILMSWEDIICMYIQCHCNSLSEKYIYIYIYNWWSKSMKIWLGHLYVEWKWCQGLGKYITHAVPALHMLAPFEPASISN